ncbi:hypothetical protein PEC301879_12490 [Pectobacterium carotovorum subsp. carotovorum]|nr:hypothetical protein PEC301879_12490 [Pectobacterium carotovorum subsp. carotovorum]
MFYEYVDISIITGCGSQTVELVAEIGAQAILITAINNMLIDLMVAMLRKDWLSRRQWQKQGIERVNVVSDLSGTFSKVSPNSPASTSNHSGRVSEI